MPHTDWNSKKIPQTLNCAPIVTILERHPAGVLKLLSLGWEGSVVATVAKRTITVSGITRIFRDWRLDLDDWEVLCDQRNMLDLLEGRRVAGTFLNAEIELRGPVFFKRDGILDLVDQLEPLPGQNGIRNSDTFKWEDWDAYQPEEFREYAEFPSEFVDDLPVASSAIPADNAPSPANRAGAKAKSQDWQDLCVVLVEMALNGNLDQTVHHTQAQLRDAILADERIKFSDETIKGLVRRLWNGPMDPTR